MERDSVIRWIRREELESAGGSLFTLPQSILDRWLRERFPGRTNEELDSVDILREMRLMEAQSLFSTDELIKLQQAGKITGKDIDERTAQEIIDFELTVEELRSE